MRSNAISVAFGLGFLFLSSFAPIRLQSQMGTVLSGVVTDAAGNAIANAKISLKSVATGQSFDAQADASGKYIISNLAPGDYEASTSANGFGVQLSRITLSAGQNQTLNLTLSAESSQQKLPSAPAAPSPPSLNDLGFSPEQTQANAQLQATLKKRTEMLKIHQRLGIITTIPMTAAVITGPMAKAKGKNGETITEPTQTNLDVHAALGGLTTALYFTSASQAIFAPKMPGTQKHGAIRWHEALAFVHGPGMILTPVLGYMAYKQENAGEKVHGIASAHGAVAYTTAAAYGAAIVAVSWPIHWKFWEKK
jgi:Carboxypeptidase regulatory-like domain